MINDLVEIILDQDNFYRSNLNIGSYVLITLKKDQGTDKLVYGRVKDILTNRLIHSRGIKVRLTDNQVGRVQKILNSSIKYMTFPKEEHNILIKDLNENYDIITTRILKEYNKYFKGDVVQTDFNYFLEVYDVKKFNDINKHPYYKYLTQNQLHIIDKNKFEVIQLFKLGTVS